MNQTDLDFSRSVGLNKMIFPDFVRKLGDDHYLEHIKKYFHFIDQWRFICNDYGKIIVDYVGKYENFENDLRYICEKLEIKYFDISENVTNRDSGSFLDIYDEEMYDIVYKIYSMDFKIFNYPR